MYVADLLSKESFGVRRRGCLRTHASSNPITASLPPSLPRRPPPHRAAALRLHRQGIYVHTHAHAHTHTHAHTPPTQHPPQTPLTPTPNLRIKTKPQPSQRPQTETNRTNKIDCGKDLEQQLGVYVECRAIFCSLDAVKDRLVLCVSELAVRAHFYMRGRHSKKTAAFAKVCMYVCICSTYMCIRCVCMYVCMHVYICMHACV